MDAELDVVIVGGGLQGLLALEALQTAGYSVALVTDGELGAGQTLHSHGFLNTGFGMLGDALPRAAAEVVQPYLRAHGVEPTGEWRLIPPPGFAPPGQVVPLPAGFESTAAGSTVASPDRNLPKTQLVTAISKGRLDRILRGRAAIEQRRGRLRHVSIRTAGGEALVLGAEVVVVAAGCGTKRIVEDLVGRTPQTEQIQHRRVHMICIRAPRGSLPAISVADMPQQLMLAAHADADSVTWYVTPLEFGGPTFDDVSTDAASPADVTTLARGLDSLQRLFPRLVDVAGAHAGAYAGYRQDVGDMPLRPLCEPLAGADNVVVALPSGLVAPWLNVARITELVADRVRPSGKKVALPAAGHGVQVGAPVEDRPSFTWLPVSEFVRSVAEAQPASSSSAT